MKVFREKLHRDAGYTASLNEHLKFLLREIPRSFAKGDGQAITVGGITPTANRCENLFQIFLLLSESWGVPSPFVRIASASQTEIIRIA